MSWMGCGPGPCDLGESGSDWLGVARSAIQARIEKYSASEIKFNLMAIIRDKRAVLPSLLRRPAIVVLWRSVTLNSLRRWPSGRCGVRRTCGATTTTCLWSWTCSRCFRGEREVAGHGRGGAGEGASVAAQLVPFRCVVAPRRRWPLGARSRPTSASRVRLALASPGCESSFGGLNYVVSYTGLVGRVDVS